MSQDWSNFVTFEVVRELLASQEKSFTAAVQQIVSDAKDKLRYVKREDQELKQSLEFTQAQLKDADFSDFRYISSNSKLHNEQHIYIENNSYK